MSIDLWIVRASPLTWDEVASAIDALAKDNSGLSRWAASDSGESTTAYFWNVGRVTVSRVTAEPDEVEEDDPPELAQPLVIVSSSSGAYPWTEWTAIELARKLAARVYDPQNAEMLEALKPENDHAALRAMHEAYLRDEKPTLTASWRASTATKDGTPAALRICAQTIDAIAKEVLGVDQSLILSAEQVNLWHTYALATGDVSVSASTDGSIGVPTTKRHFSVSGRADDARAAAFAERLAVALRLRFERVDEWRR